MTAILIDLATIHGTKDLMQITKQVRCFLKVLIQGSSVSLYVLNENQRYFVVTRDNPQTLMELTDFTLQMYFDDASDIAVVEERYNFSKTVINYRELLWGMLSTFAPSRAASYRQHLWDLPFSAQSFKDVVAYINSPDNISFYAPQPGRVKLLSFYLSAGPQMTRFTLTHFPFVGSLKYGTRLVPAIGFAMAIGDDRPDFPLTGRLSMTASYFHPSYSGHLNDSISIENYGFRFFTLTPAAAIDFHCLKIGRVLISTGPEIAYNRSVGKVDKQIWVENGIKRVDQTSGSKFVNDPWQFRWTFSARYQRLEAFSYLQIYEQDGSPFGLSVYDFNAYTAGITINYRLFKL
jgi:hypothetical protein